MEIGVEVFAQSFKKGIKVHSNSAYLTFVSLDDKGNPVKTTQLVPETEDEKRRYEEALERRENRLKFRAKKH